MDFVFVRDLAVKTITGVDAWKRPHSQPLLISIFINANIKDVGRTDHLSKSLNYDVISRNVSQYIETRRYQSLEHIAESVAKKVLSQCSDGHWTRIHVKKPRSLLRADSSEIVIARRRGRSEQFLKHDTPDLVRINKLNLVTIIGVNHIERLYRQNVEIDITMFKPLTADATYDERYDYRMIAERVCEFVEASAYKTIESFAQSVAQVVCSLGVEKVKVSAAKPSALTFAEGAGVELTRTVSDFSAQELEAVRTLNKTPEPESLFPPTAVDLTKDCHRVYLAFGTNVGEPIANVRQAIRELASRGVEVFATSNIYISEPMYVQDQERFHNGVFACNTSLSPQDLLKVIKEIEYQQFGRVKVIDNGPRPMDLDILLYDDAVMNTPELNIPHIDMLNRAFVLQPLVDVVSPELLHPLTAEPFVNHLEQLPKSSLNQSSSAMSQIIPFGPTSNLVSSKGLVVDPINHSEPTIVMAIVNVTPDSFSDGGTVTIENIVSKCLEHVKNGAHILDVGGLSTRPNSQPCSSEEELNRVVPAIQAIRAHTELANIPISIDTYRSEVAAAALDAGANIINDVFSGRMDENIFAVAARYEAPLVLSHARGTQETMNSLAKYDNVLGEVSCELAERIEAAMKAGVKRWQIILDPGLGFAKNQEQNLEIIRNFSDLRHRPGVEGYPWLVGPSRKRFIGTITGVDEAKDRVMGTATVLTSMIANGADIVRVHGTKAMAETAKMADAIYRLKP